MRSSGDYQKSLDREIKEREDAERRIEVIVERQQEIRHELEIYQSQNPRNQTDLEEDLEDLVEDRERAIEKFQTGFPEGRPSGFLASMRYSSAAGKPEALAKRIKKKEEEIQKRYNPNGELVTEYKKLERERLKLERNLKSDRKVRELEQMRDRALEAEERKKAA